MAVHTAVALPAETWTLIKELSAGGSFSVTNPANHQIRISAVATGGDAPGPTGSEPCDFLEPQQTTVYDDPDGADFYAWSPAEPRDSEDVFVFIR